MNTVSHDALTLQVEAHGLDLHDRAAIHSVAANIGRSAVFGDFDEIIDTRCVDGFSPESYIGLEHFMAFNDDSLKLAVASVATVHGKFIDPSRLGTAAANNFLQDPDNPIFNDIFVSNTLHGIQRRPLTYLHRTGNEQKLEDVQQSKKEAVLIGQKNIEPAKGLIVVTRAEAGMPPIVVPGITTLSEVLNQEITAAMAIRADSFATVFGEKYIAMGSKAIASSYLAFLLGKKLKNIFTEQV